MNYYPHHIADFNNATRHLTRVERSVYREAIELYYDTEQPLTTDFDVLAKRLLCASDEEKTALISVLNEFFVKTDSGFFHSRCDDEIEKYRANTSAKAKAGRASAEARRRKRTERQQNSTGVEQSVNEIQLTKNQEPRTKNQSTPRTKFSDEDMKCSKWIFDKIKELQPDRKEPNFNTWSNVIRMMREIDKRTHRDICDLYQWVNQDSFWQTNILSPAKLRDKWDDLQLRRSNGKNGGSSKQNAFSRSMSAIDEWERKQSATVIDGEFMEAND